MEQVTILTTVTILTPVIVGLVQVLKGFNLSSKWNPVFAIAFGILGAYLLLGGLIATIIWVGILAGLTASGLYSATTALTK